MAATTKKPRAAATTKKPRADGPIKIEYVSGDKTSKRLIAGVSSIVITDKATSKKSSFDLEQIGEETVNALALRAVSKIIDSYVRNTFDPATNNATALVAAAVKKINAGDIYTSISGGKPGKTFDVEMWVETIQMAAQRKKKTPTDRQLSDLRVKLMATDGKERTQMLLAWMRDPVIALAFAEVKAKRLKAVKVTAGGYDAFDNMF